ncbi:hypothetical protein ACIA59_10485 [Micromonospora haikouensis]|uniref:hypothetical protein n=1 Tax=Micromonospora haikouensis TaxID=686309 RepID=UPI0037A263EB
MTTLDPKTIAADLMTGAARDICLTDVCAHMGQAYDIPTVEEFESLADKVLDLVKVAGIDLLWPDGTRDTELDAQRVENERIAAHRDELRARIDAAHDALSRLDGVDEDSTATLESTVEYLAGRWQHLCDAEAAAAAEVDRLRAELADAEERAASMRAALDDEDAEAVAR